MLGILYTIASIFLLLWILGFVFHLFFVGLGMGIHALLAIAVIMFLIGLARGRSSTV